MTVIEAHLVCACLVAADVAARSWRIQLLVRGVGHRIGFREALSLNLVGDAACALTPLRIAGEPVRLAGMLRARVSASAAFVAITCEVLAAWPVIISIAMVLAWRHLPEWWERAGSRLGDAASIGWPWVAGVVLLTLLAWIWIKFMAPGITHHLRQPFRRSLVHWRRMPAEALLLSLPLSAVNVLARVAILPVLASTLPSPPAAGPVLVGSFALLYSQLILPTPSGAGAVELGFLAGAAGDLGAEPAWLLLWWRGYTSGVGILLGVWIGVRIYGWHALRALIPGRRAVG